MLVKFQDSYNTRRWGGLYTNAKHWGKWACGSERSRVHTKLATAGLGRNYQHVQLLYGEIMIDV